MALNPELIRFFVERISKSQMKTFGSEVAQLFHHIDNEVKDNPVFLKYEKEKELWKNFVEEESSFGVYWKFPTEFEKAKSLAYNVYRKVASQKEEGYSFADNTMSGDDINDSIYKLNETFLEYFTKSLDDIIRANPEIETEEPQRVSGNTVFIIHGHDTQLKTEVQLLLVRAGVRNIVLHEQADKGRTIVDKLIEESNSSNYAIALFSPDDVLKDGSKRARQNVVLEVGYFIGKLGKERVRMLVKKNVEIPTDLSGILYEKHDSIGAWKMKILKELQAVGIFVDFKVVFEKF